MKLRFVLYAAILCVAAASAQTPVQEGGAQFIRISSAPPEEQVIIPGHDPKEDVIRTTNFPQMRTIVNSDIPGAPILSQPQRIDGSMQEIRTEKHGLVYPAFFDWNGDGKKDLMLGEFETGDTGSYIKVYMNEGTDAEPAFTGKYSYAMDINGDTISNHQWCCIGIHPRVVDFDGDGYSDILSGQYNPGLISLWRGSAKGFLPRVFVDQVGLDVNGGTGGMTMLKPGETPPAENSPGSFSYWNYTSADFGDFNGDGLIDLFVGGSGGPRVALNEGTKDKPVFGLRKYLEYTGMSNSIDARTRREYDVDYGKSYLHPVDWDGDGVLDMLMTNEYTDRGQSAIEFFKGVDTPDGIKFEKPVPLFFVEQTKSWMHVSRQKALPGCQPMISVVDYNNDGVLDIVVGISIPTINGFEAAPEIAWEWVHNMGIQSPGKDTGRAIGYLGGLEGAIKRIEEQPAMKRYYLGNLEDYKYLTLRHRGYVFVMYGSENPVKATPVPAVGSNSEPVLMGRSANSEGRSFSSEQVSYVIELPENAEPGKEYTANVVFSFGKGWHGYSDDKVNAALGFIPTKVEFTFPEAVITGRMTISSDGPIYEGDKVVFSQKFTCPKQGVEGGYIPVRADIQWQVCDENMCLPPQEDIVEMIISSR